MYNYTNPIMQQVAKLYTATANLHKAVQEKAKPLEELTEIINNINN
jgi:hypothetical protein